MKPLPARSGPDNDNDNDTLTDEVGQPPEHYVDLERRRCRELAEALRRRAAAEPDVDNTEAVVALCEDLVVAAAELPSGPDVSELRERAFDTGWNHAVGNDESAALRDPSLPPLRPVPAERAGEHDLVVDFAGQASVAVVLPWFGAQRRHYESILKFWKECGFATATLNRPMIATPHELASASLGLLVALNAVLQQGAQHIILHAMSMNGACVLARMLLIEGHTGSPVFSSICGVIFDSAPINISAAPGVRLHRYIRQVHAPAAMQSLLGKAGSLEDPVATPAYVAGFLASASDRVLRGMTTATSLRMPWFTEALLTLWPVEAAKLRLPHLVLFSDADRTCRADAIDSAMQEMTTKGLKMRSYQFRGSAHCQHHKTHAAEYRRLVLEFANEHIARPRL